ncbi:MAG TPA: hypothetical protein VGX28_15255 [Frankiaceae bacterium]|jgi:hypothetical protein|nr:hypothetical protein [Frankiaceae bacterium]
MRRSQAAGVALAAALVAVAVPLLGTASAAPCPTWTDPAGDASMAGQAPDDSVDITAVLVQQDATGLTVTFTVPGLKSANEYSPGDRFQLAMDAGGSPLTVYGDRDDAGYQATTGSVAGASGPAGAKSGGTVKHDVAGKKVVLTMPYTLLDTAMGKPFAGLALKSFSAASSVHFGPFTSNDFDKATAPAGVTAVGAQACGGSGPAPTTGPTVAPKPTATATPSPKPSATPSPTPSPTATTPAPNGLPTGLPRAGCFHVVDPTGDAHVGNANVPNDPDLDITGLTLRSTGGWVLAYVKADKLATAPATADGHRYSFEFTFNKHLFTVGASAYDSAQSEDVREGIAATGMGGHMVQLSVDTVSTLSAATAADYAAGQVSPPFVDSGAQASFDTKNGWVTIGLPIADIEKYGQAKLSGALTGVVAKSAADYWRNSLNADNTVKDNGTTSTDTWTVGDNKCFPQPVATALSLTVAKRGSSRTVTARLTAAGKPLAGQTVTWLVNGKKVGTATTTSAGTAVLTTAKPTQTVTVEFAGVADQYLASRATARV